MISLEQTPRTIEAREVSQQERMAVLPRHFGRFMLTVEHTIYAFMREFSREYSGGYWKYFELSNGGFFMTPQHNARFKIIIDSNGYEGEMSAEAAGITVCLFTFSHLSFRIGEAFIADHFHQLREFALEHPEADAILAAID